MILDGHIHTREFHRDPGQLLNDLRRAGIDGGLIISLPPDSFPHVAPSCSAIDRIDNVLAVCKISENLYPFYWIDPMEADAEDQVALAVKKGVAGFKVICDRYYPGDKRALEIFRVIAETRRPILFHSGILWDGKPSSKYNRPVEFEALLEVKRLRFSLAHIAWPWCDELIAVYGKFLNSLKGDPDSDVEMFIDITPGTPAIYRREALTRLCTVGYDVEHHILFGTDSNTTAYNVEWAQNWIHVDTGIFRELGLLQPTINRILGDNLKRFVERSSAASTRKTLRPGV